VRRELLRYDLPPELIAQRPPDARDGGRLLVVGAASLEHRAVRDLDELIAPGSLLVVNDTRVVPARLFGKKVGTGGRVELFLVSRPDAAGRARAMGRASKPLRPGAEIAIDGGELTATIERRDGDTALVEITLRASAGDVAAAVERAGHVPLPPYVDREDDALDRERYQTVFARAPGAVAAPTAGLHLSSELLERLRVRGVAVASITLHVGLGTFQPVTADDLDDHAMHAEWFEVTAEAARAIDDARSRRARVVAVGTTVVRALESAADVDRAGAVRASSGETRMLIQPGHRFRVVDELLTNFHLPESTLLALVSAFAGRERVLAAYRAAVDARYRFFSYGDAMLLRARVEPEATP
jgi:S-adenosylmethionine:tRNA ribosyltransferase-isomerase